MESKNRLPNTKPRCSLCLLFCPVPRRRIPRIQPPPKWANWRDKRWRTLDKRHTAPPQEAFPTRLQTPVLLWNPHWLVLPNTMLGESEHLHLGHPSERYVQPRHASHHSTSLKQVGWESYGWCSFLVAAQMWWVDRNYRSKSEIFQNL